ncbi:MAG: succinyl-diaminopimelate desuccinylase [Geminicoccaceae bacterium]
MGSPLIDLAAELIGRQSITPDDAGCQDVLTERLEHAGFDVESMGFGETRNIWCCHGSGNPLLVLAGHTDVVPAGDLERWQSPPFSPVVRDGHLFGRGAADMKGSVAAMVRAAENFVRRFPNHPGTLAFLITSAEEGPFEDGTIKVVDVLERRGVRIDWALVGEPSSREVLGDTLRVGRRGSLSAKLTIHGKQGHTAYPDQARNAVHIALPALLELSNLELDQGNAFFPPSSFQISNIAAGTGAMNVIPGKLQVEFGFRYSSELSADRIRRMVAAILERHGLNHEIEWSLIGEPFLTRDGALLSALRQSLRDITGVDSISKTDGGTSDGRFLARIADEVIEFGPCSATIHGDNECIGLIDLERLAQIYEDVLVRLLATDRPCQEAMSASQ